jgi:signal transduction histidine kinase
MINDNIKSLAYDGKDIVWVGTQNGLMKYNVKQDKLLASKKVQHTSITDIAVSGDHIFFGTYLHGFQVYGYRSGRVSGLRKLYTKNSSVPSVLIDHQIAWIGFLKEGIGRISLSDWKYEHYPPKEEDPNWHGGYMINSIVREELNKYIWFGAIGRGLFRYDPEKNTFKTYHLPGTDTSQVNQYSVYDMELMGEDTLWIATGSGLYYVNLKQDKIFRYPINETLNNQKIHSIVFDDYQGLWLGTKDGLYRLNIYNKKYKKYTTLDGLPGNSFSIGVKLKLPDGRIMLGTRTGLSIFDPESILINPIPPEVVLTDVRIMDHSLEPTFSYFEDGKLHYKSVTEIENLNITYQDRVVTFEFAALEYNKPEAVKYKYKLEGFEEQWNEVEALTRQATYTNLKGGDYTFRVIASNGDGIWNKKGLKVNLNVRPPFWKTHWFNTLAIIFILLGFYFVYAIRLRSLRVQKYRLRQKVNEKTRELTDKNEMLSMQADQLNETNTLLEERQQRIEEQSEELMVQKDELGRQAEELTNMNSELKDLNEKKNRFFSIIAHDIKNPFNAIMGFIEMLKLEGKKLSEEKRETYVAAIYTSSRALYNLLENLLLWARAQSDRVKFNPRKFPVRAIVNESLFIQKENYRKKSIDIEVILNEKIEVIADQDQLNIVIRNLIGNAIKFTGEQGKIKIKGITRGDDFLFEVSDTGVGISKESIGDLFRIDRSVTTKGTDGEKGTGLGLILCKEFIENHGGEIWVESEEGKGTIFGFSIPRHYKDNKAKEQ